MPRYNLGDVSFIAVAGILVFFMVPGVGESASLSLTLVRPHRPRLPHSVPIFRAVATKERPVVGVGSSCE